MKDFFVVYEVAFIAGSQENQNDYLQTGTRLIVKSLIKSNKDKEPKQQGIHISQPPLFPQSFDPCPRFL